MINISIIKNKTNEIIMFVLIGYLFLISVFEKYFVQIHISIPGLSFPIFISEIFLFLSVILLVLKYKEYFKTFKNRNMSFYFLCFYILFLLIKALYGFFAWGALAFRNAALFYYIIFGVVSYITFDLEKLKKVLENKRILIEIIILLSSISVFQFFRERYVFIYCIVLVLLLFNIKNNKIRNTLLFFYVSFFMYNMSSIGKRSILIGFALSMIFIGTVLFVRFLKYKAITKIFIVLVLVSGIGLTVFQLADRNALKTLSSFDKPLKEYFEIRKKIKAIEGDFEPWHVEKIKVYEKEIDSENRLGTKRKRRRKKKEKVEELEELILPEGLVISKGDKLKNGFKFPDGFKFPPGFKIPQGFVLIDGVLYRKTHKKAKKRFVRDFTVARKNITWRMIVLGDMVDEIIEEHKIFGLDFGHPFRAFTIEMLGWSSHGLWTGWLEPHNSYVHAIYRAGVIGIIYIIILVVFFIRLVKGFIVKKDFKGILLCSILLYWFVIANFEVILELPQFAVFIWSMLGITYKYSKGKSNV